MPEMAYKLTPMLYKNIFLYHEVSLEIGCINISNEGSSTLTRNLFYGMGHEFMIKPSHFVNP